MSIPQERAPALPNPPKETVSPGGNVQNCLLTEFSGMKLSRFMKCESAGPILAVALIFGALVVLGLGYIGRADGLMISITPVLNISDGSGMATIKANPAVHIYGYLAELSHGFFFLFLAPLFALVAFRFIRDSDKALTKLTIQGRILKLGKFPTANAYVGVRNKTLFRFSPIILFVILFAFSLIVEGKSFLHVKAGKSYEVGYVQAPFLDQWLNHFTATSPAKQLEIIRNFDLTAQLAENIKATLNNYATTPTNWYPFIKPNDTLESRPEIILQALHSGNFTISLDKAAQNGAVQFIGGVQGGPKKGNLTQQLAFAAFLIFLIGYEACFHAFGAWMGLKIIFWLITLYSFLPTGNNRFFRLKPLMADPVYRFGLFDLHPAYNNVVHLLLLTSVTMSLNYISNAAKGTFFYNTSGASPFFGQVLIHTAIFTVTFAIIAGPIWLFGSNLNKLREKRLEELDIEIGKANRLGDELKEKTLEAEKETVRKQTTWPWDDRTFQILLAAFGAFVALPWVSMIHQMPDSFKKYANILNVAKDLVTKITAWVCRLDK